MLREVRVQAEGWEENVRVKLQVQRRGTSAILVWVEELLFIIVR